jgi:hypothetical protein
MLIPVSIVSRSLEILLRAGFGTVLCDSAVPKSRQVGAPEVPAVSASAMSNPRQPAAVREVFLSLITRSRNPTQFALG